ncbi:DUF2169 domain-containing protein [Bordetella sp. BOR01]|uniref:DUF2169 domain-containing protein n=1 Tax=Bordetella sp. BOR01 TaxID=2854779 RepID=UPI001C44AFE7|nr:DUF2169 domain-containing protein [Bordetella sp. BOR01]MBV7481797.1 pentapeptide repeat-containing protein [Bordetella sp. BOR01]
MKFIKPLRLTVMPRPYQWRGMAFLSVAVAVLVRHKPEGVVIETEQTLLNDILPELDADEVLDFVMPKPHPEYLVSGGAYTAHQQDKTRCMVSVRVGDKRKDGLVFGDRYWIGDQISDPQPFEMMPLTWSRSFGGETVPDNPQGAGVDEVEINGTTAVRLPNLESPVERINSKGQQVAPYNFGLIGIDRPQRLSKLGSADEKWIKEVGTGFFDDLQFSAFNAASDDQVWQDRDALAMDEPFEFWNMHPELHCWSGSLAALRARCFIKRKDADALDEVPMRPTTVWFLPHRTSYVLLFHGQVPIVESDAVDVSTIMAAMEHADRPRSMAHYTHVFARRMNFDTAALETLRDADLMPGDILAPWLENISLEKHALLSKLTDRLRRDTGAYQPGGFVGPVKPVTLTDLPEMAEHYQQMHQDVIEQQRHEQQKVYEETRRSVEQTGNERDAELFRAVAGALLPQSGEFTLPHRGPPDLDSIFQSVRNSQFRSGLRASFSGKEAEGISTRELYAHGKRALKQTYLYSVHFQQGVAKAAPHRVQQIRDQVEKKYRLNRNLSDMDLTGADLSNMDLAGADFSRTWLERADLTNTNLAGARFEEAVLARASFVTCCLDNAVFTRSNISEAVFEGVSFKGTKFEGVICETRTVFDRCAFESGAMDGFVMKHVEWRNCGMREMELRDLTFEDSAFSDTAIAESRLDKVSFEHSTIENLCIDECVLSACAAFESTFRHGHLNNSFAAKCVFLDTVSFDGYSFQDSHIQQTMFREIQFKNVSFQGATLEQCDFTQARLTGCDLRKIESPQALFVRANLDMADLSDSNLMQANFQKASFVGANLTGCNFFRADMSETLLDASTRADGAYVQRVKLVPRRKNAQATLGG